MKEKWGVGLSPGCSIIFDLSIVLPSILGGVPVFNLPTGRFNSLSLAANFVEDGSPALPAL